MVPCSKYTKMSIQTTTFELKLPGDYAALSLSQILQAPENGPFAVLS